MSGGARGGVDGGVRGVADAVDVGARGAVGTEEAGASTGGGDGGGGGGAVRRLARAALLALCGVGLLRTSLLTDAYLRYVKEGMRPLLIASGVLLVGLAVAEAVSAWRARGRGHGGEHLQEGGAEGEHVGQGTDGEHLGQGTDGHGADPGRDGRGGDDGSGAHGRGGHEGHGHDHSSVPRVAWLLFLPALSLLFYAPPALGSYTAARESPKAVAVVAEDGFDPLPATSPLPITLTDFTQRVQQDEKRAIRGRTVLMSGFVTPADGDSWYLTRIMLSCCAADAQSVKVRVYGVEAPKADTWVSVTGTWHAGGTLGTSSAAVALDGTSARKIPRPSNGYTDALPLGS